VSDHRGRDRVPRAAIECASRSPLGRNVYIGGHNFSHQTYGPKRKLRVHLYERQPRNAGCK
jgi:hypothetical protein